MANILIVYGSTTGNTQTVAESIQTALMETDHAVTIYNGSEIGPEEIKSYDYSLIGCSTWGDGEIQDDMLEFTENIPSIDLSGSKVAVFACGMSSFPQFCHAGELISDALESSGAELSNDMFTIDGEVADELENACEWALASIKA